MRPLERLPLITLVMSLPLFFSVQLQRPPGFLQGLPFVVLWTWGVVAALIVPLLIIIEGAFCLWLLFHRPIIRSTLFWHGGALCVAILAETVFLLTRERLL
jgi:hypothetical protein